jgi:cobalt-zinc-cadmium efflux system outer membrane protein
VLGNGAAISQEPAELTPEQVELTVMTAFPDIEAARAALEAAQEELQAARPLPDVLLEVGGLRTTALAGSATTTEPAGAIEWEVPLPWSYRPGKAVAAAGVATARAGLARTELEVRGRVRALLVELAAAQERVEVLAAQRSLTADLAKLITLRVELGETRELERLRLVVELERIERELELARAGTTALAAVLAHLSGTLPASFRLTARLTGSMPEPNLEQLLAGTLASNPLIAERAAGVEAAAAALALARGQRSPSLISRFVESRDLDTRSQGLSVGLYIPLWNANRGGIAAAAARLRQGEASLEAARREVGAAVVAAAERLRSALTIARRMGETALPAARAAQEIADFALREGETSLLDALDARRALQAVALEDLEARRQLHLLRTGLEALAALPMDPHLDPNGNPPATAVAATAQDQQVSEELP